MAADCHKFENKRTKSNAWLSNKFELCKWNSSMMQFWQSESTCIPNDGCTNQHNAKCTSLFCSATDPYLVSRWRGQRTLSQCIKKPYFFPTEHNKSILGYTPGIFKLGSGILRLIHLTKSDSYRRMGNFIMESWHTYRCLFILKTSFYIKEKLAWTS